MALVDSVGELLLHWIRLILDLRYEQDVCTTYGLSSQAWIQFIRVSHNALQFMGSLICIPKKLYMVVTS